MIQWQMVLSSLVGAVIALALLVFFQQPGWCEGAELPGTCAREWISATSGWAAALVAIGAAWITYKPLRAQIAEARRQTDFVVGDAAPTLDLYESLDMVRVCSVDMRIVNWNRRSMDIEEITIDVLPVDPDVHSAGLGDLRLDGNLIARRYQEEVGDVDLYRVFRFVRPIYMRGWEDRSKAPPFLTAEIIIGVETDEPKPVTRPVEVTVTARQSGDKSRRLKLTAQGNFLIRD